MFFDISAAPGKTGDVQKHIGRSGFRCVDGLYALYGAVFCRDGGWKGLQISQSTADKQGRHMDLDGNCAQRGCVSDILCRIRECGRYFDESAGSIGGSGTSKYADRVSLFFPEVYDNCFLPISVLAASIVECRNNMEFPAEGES